jgi:soluble lytic murein transglycosylase-like protein
MRHHVALLLVAAAGAAGAVAYTSHARARAAEAPPSAGPVAMRPATCLARLPYERLFRDAAAATGIPETLLVAVAEQESRLDAQARSPASARGLMQVLPRTAKELGLDAARSNENVLAGALYLRRMLQEFHSLDLALAAYNTGPSIVERLHRAPTVAVLGYVQNVTARWVALSGCRS